MPRAIWSGSISFGLVNVPVKLYSAVHQQDLHFNQFEEGSNARIHYKRISEKTGKEVAYEDIVKGYELTKGHYVMIDPKELEEFTPRTTRTVDIEDFVSLEEIDPIYYEHTYYLVPDGEGAARAYALLRQAMTNQEKVAVGRLVMRTKQYLAAIRPLGNALALSTMLFHDEVVPVADIDGVPTARVKADPREVKMAEQIIESLTSEWKPERYKDTYREEVLEFIEKKAAGEEIVVEGQAEETDKVVDLMAALEASLAGARGEKKPAATKASGSTKKSSGSTKKAGSTKSSGSAKKAATTTKTASKSGGPRRKSA